MYSTSFPPAIGKLSSCRATSTDIPDPLPQPLSIVHRFRQVLIVTSSIGTELLYVGSCRSSCLCSSMWRDPPECITNKFVPTSLAVSCMSGFSNLDIFRDNETQFFFQAAIVSTDTIYWRRLNVWWKSLTVTTHECCEHYWTSPRGSTSQSSSCTTIYHPSSVNNLKKLGCLTLFRETT